MNVIYVNARKSLTYCLIPYSLIVQCCIVFRRTGSSSEPEKQTMSSGDSSLVGIVVGSAVGVIVCMVILVAVAVILVRRFVFILQRQITAPRIFLDIRIFQEQLPGSFILLWILYNATVIYLEPKGSRFP